MLTLVFKTVSCVHRVYRLPIINYNMVDLYTFRTAVGVSRSTFYLPSKLKQNKHGSRGGCVIIAKYLLSPIILHWAIHLLSRARLTITPQRICFVSLTPGLMTVYQIRWLIWKVSHLWGWTGIEKLQGKYRAGKGAYTTTSGVTLDIFMWGRVCVLSSWNSWQLVWGRTTCHASFRTWQLYIYKLLPWAGLQFSPSHAYT